jgi:Phage Mu protein F like protein
MHAAGERRFAAAAFRFFKQQGRRLIVALAGVGTVMPHDLAAALDWQAETQLFLRTVARPQLLAVATSCATVQFQLLRAGKSFAFTTKAFDDDDGGTVEGELPENMRAAIRNEVELTLREPYWHRIADDDTREIVQDAINNALENQLGGEGRLSKLISSATGGDISRSRARRIARTETTGAANAGQDAVLEGMAREGIRLGKEWLSIADASCRTSHMAMNGVRVGPGERFLVGPLRTPAPFPGFRGLPADERVNCRCCFVSTGETEG